MEYYTSGVSTILLEIHPFFPEPNEYGRKGVNTSPTTTWKRKSRTQKKTGKKTVQHTLRQKMSPFFSLSGLIFLYAMICSFRVEFPSVSDFYVMFVLPFRLTFHESQRFLSLKTLQVRWYSRKTKSSPLKIPMVGSDVFPIEIVPLKSGTFVSFQGCRSSTLSSSPKPLGNESDFLSLKSLTKSDDTVDGNQKSGDHQLIW